MPLSPDRDGIFLAQLVEGNPVATIVIDDRHRVTHWNRACAALTGVPAEEMIGRSEQWRAFYSTARPILADLIVDGAAEAGVDQFYHGKFKRSALIDEAFEAEDYFPAFGPDGRWLYFTAAPLRNEAGDLVGAIETLQDVTKRRQAEEALRESEERYRQLSLTDSLTGLFNSRHLHDRIHYEMERAGRYRRPLSLLVLDCDDFKKINDTYGHLDGDKVLQRLADIIRHCLRSADSAYRYGGEEFVVLLPEADGESAWHLADRLRHAFAGTEVMSESGEAIRCTVSIGVAEHADGDTANSLIRRADDASYRAKQKGKNCVVLEGAPY